ncbi:hypothetical protein SDC9_209545 [bioreactor metagenome]|uniref:Uncharacterized protein n=1 Tax=bioreactor metagenome TaxID=1076179 RepID=A0A645JDY4_9ZZZZ|nr:hypothetical protein [Bacteroidaceae bacterium]
MFHVGQITKNKRGDKIKILSFPENYPGYMWVKNYSHKGIDSTIMYPISGKWFPERNPNGSESDIIDNNK